MRKLVIVFLMMLVAVPVFAEGKYSIKQMTPQVQDALNSRRDRFEQLRTLKSSGDIGENYSGYVEALTGNSTAQSLASAENKDRRTIYQTIAEQNGIADNVATIERVFGQVQRDKAQAGDKIQDESGSWSTK